MTNSRAMLLALAGFFAWVLVDAAIKFTSMGQDALSPFIVMSALGFCGAASIGGVAVSRRKLHLLRPHNLKGQAAIGVCSACIWFVNVFALKHLPLTMFYVAVFSAPLVIAAIAAFLKHEKLTALKVACLISGFGGVAIAIGIPGGGGDIIGYVCAFASVLFFSTYTTLIKSVSKTDTAESTQFISSIVVGMFGLIGAAFHTAATPDARMLAFIIAGGVINAIGNVLYNKALQNTDATNVAQLHYTQIISGAIIGYFIWQEIPTWNLLLGAAIIIAAGITVAAQARKGDRVCAVKE